VRKASAMREADDGCYTFSLNCKAEEDLTLIRLVQTPLCPFLHHEIRDAATPWLSDHSFTKNGSALVLCDTTLCPSTRGQTPPGEQASVILQPCSLIKADSAVRRAG